MAVFVTCSCGTRFQVPDTFVGRIARCPTCGSAQPLPNPGEGPEAVAPDTNQPIQLLPEIEEDSLDDQVEKPRRKAVSERKSRRPRRPILASLAGWARWVNIWFLLVPLFLGFGFIVESIRELRVSGGASARPQSLTLEQLATQGPGGNNHVALTGFTPGEGCVAFHTDRRHRIIRLIEGEKPPPSKWELTEAPLFLGPDRRRVVAVVEAERVSTEAEYESWRSRREIRGMITGKLVLDSKTGRALQELYPGVDLSNCYVLVEGRTPTSMRWTGVWLMSGMVLLLLAVAGLGLRFLSPRS